MHACDSFQVKPEAQQLFNGDNIMQDDKKLSEVGFNGDSAGALQPAVVVLSMKKSGKTLSSFRRSYSEVWYFPDGTFEGKSVTPLSTPPPLDELLRRNVEQSAGAGDQKSGPVPSSATTEPQTAWRESWTDIEQKQK